MALYLGNSGKKKIYLGNILRNLHILSANIIVNGTKLLSSDNLTLKDCNGVYLTIEKEDDE